jgi:hypothetical protein
MLQKVETDSEFDLNVHVEPATLSYLPILQDFDSSIGVNSFPGANHDKS